MKMLQNRTVFVICSFFSNKGLRTPLYFYERGAQLQKRLGTYASDTFIRLEWKCNRVKPSNDENYWRAKPARREMDESVENRSTCAQGQWGLQKLKWTRQVEEVICWWHQHKMTENVHYRLKEKKLERWSDRLNQNITNTRAIGKCGSVKRNELQDNLCCSSNKN